MFSSRFHQLRYYSGKNLTFLISYPQPNNLHFRNHQMIVHKEKAFNDPEKSHFIHVNPVAVPSVDFASINRIGVRQVFCMSVWYRISLQPARCFTHSGHVTQLLSNASSFANDDFTCIQEITSSSLEMIFYFYFCRVSLSLIVTLYFICNYRH